jgi:hypothetical protein
VYFEVDIEVKGVRKYMVLSNGEIIFDCDDDKCELCGTTFELGYFRNRILCTECAKAEKERESIDED